MLNKKKLFLAFLPIFFIGCSWDDLNPFHKTVQECDPYFFTHYVPKKDEIVGIGIAGPNINGLTAQKKSAIAKAINEIATQLGVKVDSFYAMNKKMVNRSRSYSRAESFSLQSVEGKKVRAKVVKECKAKDGYYYVLMKAY